jgi:hypothetical protein
VKNFRRLPAIGMVAAVIALSGCGGGGDDDSSSNASLRLVNATLTHASLDLLVNTAVAAPATATDKASAYVSPPSGSVTLQINDAGGGTALATSLSTLTGGNHYTMVAYESGGAIKTVILNEDFVIPAAGVATLRIFDAAAEAGKLDVYVTTNACTSLTGVSPSYSFVSPTTTTSVSLTQGAGTYNVCATAQGNQNDLRLSQSITLAGAQVATVVMTPTVGGQLINGALLIQQGTYTAARNPNARVRLAAAVSGGASVAAFAGGVLLDTLAAPGLGFVYKLVPANSALTVAINGGVAVAAPTAPAVGADVTLLAYGSAASPTLSLIADDNRLPTDNTTKLRFINGITGSAGTLTLTANSTLIGNGIAPGTASGYASVPATSTATILKLSSSTNSSLLTDGTNVLSANAVYTILAGGDISAPILLLR